MPFSIEAFYYTTHENSNTVWRVYKECVHDSHACSCTCAKDWHACLFAIPCACMLHARHHLNSVSDILPCSVPQMNLYPHCLYLIIAALLHVYLIIPHPSSLIPHPLSLIRTPLPYHRLSLRSTASHPRRSRSSALMLSVPSTRSRSLGAIIKATTPFAGNDT